MLPEKQTWAHHQDQALSPASPKPRAFTHVFLHLSFSSILNIVIYLQKILKGFFFLISHCMSSFRKQVEEDSIPSGEHVANG